MSLFAATKYIHIMLGSTLMGLVIATLFYVLSSRQKPWFVMNHALRVSFFADGLTALIICYQFHSGYFLMQQVKLSLATPWIVVAFVTFTIITLLWLGSFFIRLMNYRQLHKNKHRTPFRYLYVFIIIHILILLLFTLIIHDAVAHNTWFNF